MFLVPHHFISSHTVLRDFPSTSCPSHYPSTFYYPHFYHPYFAICILLAAFYYPHFANRILLSAFCHPYFTFCIFSSSFSHPSSAAIQYHTLQKPFLFILSVSYISRSQEHGLLAKLVYSGAQKTQFLSNIIQLPDSQTTLQKLQFHLIPETGRGKIPHSCFPRGVGGLRTATRRLSFVLYRFSANPCYVF